MTHRTTGDPAPVEGGNTRREFLVTTGAAATVAVAGCPGDGRTDDAPGTDGFTLTMWDHVGEDPDDPNSVWVMENGDLFEDETGHEFELEGHPDRLTEQVLTSYQTGDAPDIVHDFSEQFNQYIQADNVEESPLMPLDDYVGDLPKETFDVVWPGVTFEGSIYGVPQTVNARNWFYNKRLVEEAGYDPETLEPRTLGELEQLIADIDDATDASGWSWEGGATAYNWYYPQHFTRSWFGVEYVEPYVRLDDGSEGLYTGFLFDDSFGPADIADPTVIDVEVRANSDEMIAAVGWLKNQREDGYVYDDVMTIDTGDLLTNVFPSERVGLCFTGPWGYDLLDQHVDDFDWGTFPPITDGSTGGVSGKGYFVGEPGKPLMVIDQTENPDAAGEFLNIWFSKERQEAFVEKAGNLSIRPEVNVEENFTIPQLTGLNDIVDEATFYDGAELLPEVDLWNTTGSVVQEIISEDQNIEERLSELQNILEERYREELS
jgi:ABC-type glycerol-3-phosphate transport system substrate-binding protein